MMLRRGWVCGLLSAGWLAAVGCSTCHLTSVPPVDDDVREACAAIAVDSRCHLHLFFVQGADPLDTADLEGLKETMQALGFTQAWYGASFHAPQLKKAIASACHEDAKAHFVLVGYGKGVKTAVDLANTVGTQGVHFDLMVCLGERADKPACVSSQITVLTFNEPCDLHEKDVVHVPADKKSKIPLHPETVELLARELYTLAGGIPSETDLPKMYSPEHEPTPRPRLHMPSEQVSNQERDEWDFLKPAPVDDQRESLPPGTLPENKKKKPTPRREVLHSSQRSGA
jgi:hypothetical protein